MRTLTACLVLAAGAFAPLAGQQSADLRSASQLPLMASRLAAAGLPEAELQKALEAMRQQRVPAADAARVLEAEVPAAESDAGPRGNFGEIVQRELASGKRGRDLAAAISAAKPAVGQRGATRAIDLRDKNDQVQRDTMLRGAAGKAAGGAARPIPEAEKSRQERKPR